MTEGRQDNSQDGNTWRSLYKVGGVAGLIATALFVTDIVVLVAGGEAPESAQAWFTLLRNDRAAGLIQLFFTDLVGLLLMVPFILALYAGLRKASPAYSALAAAFAVVGLPLVFATNTNYLLINLSDQYAAATEAQRSTLLAAAESGMASGMYGTGIAVASFLLEGSLLMISVIMLRGTAFGKWIAYLGIVAHGLDFAHALVVLILTPIINADVAWAIGQPLLAVGGTFQLLWYPLVAWKLLQLGRRSAPEAAL